ncbi:MAG TPA: long-chain fatty acid--CoA ligase [Spirochaetota bacterium]|nr:long-chain fatty acid--CoA ligase [Spirochaetota bacterium]HPR74142.1 long-chain fatty acid--CoA ligase [Bacteroidales bacterium]HRX49207.1 long-chain fatty acid--CoA ligase [Spirochaetota bacterium]
MEYLEQKEHRWYIKQQTFPELLNRNVTQFSSKKAQMWKNKKGEIETVNYAQLGRIVKEITCGLMALGVNQGDRVAIMCNTRPEWVWCDYGVLCAAGITVCIYPTLSTHEMSYILNDSGAKILFIEDKEGLEKSLSIADSIPALEKIVVIDNVATIDDSRVINLDSLRELGCGLITRDRFSFENRWRSVKITDRMTIVYTSGTTGNPKGAVHTHFSVNAAVLRDMTFSPFIEDDFVCLSFLPLSHTYERECGHGIAMQAAITIAYSSPQTLITDFADFKPNVFMSVPRIYERIYMALKAKASQSSVGKSIFNRAITTGLKIIETISDENGFIDVYPYMDITRNSGFFLKMKYRLYDKLIFSKVREMMGGRFVFACSAAGSLSPELCKLFLAMGLIIYEGYGSTETCNTINMNRIHRVLPGSVGPLCPGVEGYIAEDGEWCVRGNNVFLEYWNNPEATREAFTEDGYYKTGDIVEMLPEGFIKIVDRKKGLIVLDTGKNIASSKVEQAFSTSAYVDLAFAVGDSQKFIGALIVPNFEEFIRLFEEKKIQYNKSSIQYYNLNGVNICEKVGNDFIEVPALREIIDKEVERINRDLESYERIKKYVILNRRLTEKSGEMTPTLKVKRKVVIGNLDKEITSLFS